MLSFSKGVDLAKFEPNVDAIVTVEPLRQALVFGILAAVFEALYTGVDGQAMMVEKKEHYQWRYERAVEQLTVNVDTDGNGDADNSIMPLVVQLARR